MGTMDLTEHLSLRPEQESQQRDDGELIEKGIELNSKKLLVKREYEALAQAVSVLPCILTALITREAFRLQKGTWNTYRAFAIKW